MRQAMQRQVVPTHLTAVLGLVLTADSILLLRRTRKPRVWAPPGGRLLPDENPTQGLQREIQEECSISIDVIMPISTWFGRHDKAMTLAIIYLCRYVDGLLTLSSEHSEARWFTEESLRAEMAKSPENFFGEVDLYQFAFSLNNFIQHRVELTLPNSAIIHRF